MRIKLNDHLQLGWNCFDVAVGITREELVSYALEHSDEQAFRTMLASEIRHAAALTVSYMNLQSASAEPEIKQTLRLFELSPIKKALNPDDSLNKSIIDRDIEQLSLSVKKDIVFPRGALPESMRTEELQVLINKYQQAHEDMIVAVAACNTALRFPEGARLSLAALDDFFTKKENYVAHAAVYKIFKEARDAVFTPHEQAFYNYCESEVTYRKYITDYYNQHGWVAFQRSFTDERNTSMVDIAARMISSCIIIHRLKNGKYKEIHRTKNYGPAIKHVEFYEYCHFIGLDPDAPDIDEEESKGLSGSKAGTADVSSPPGKELLLSQGFAGSIYQVKILMLLAFNAFYKQQRFHLYTEAKGFGKFDDCVLVLEDRMQVMQVKHSFATGGRYLLKHLTVDDDKKAVLSKYFDSWLMIEASRRKDKEAGRDPKTVEYLFFTNHALSVEDGLSALYNEATGRFAETLLGEALTDERQEDARKAILRSLYRYIEMIQQQITTACNEVIALFAALPKTSGMEDAVYVKVDACSKNVKILLALLLKCECIALDKAKGTYRGNPYYKFTYQFLSTEKAKKLPPVLDQLRKLLVKKDKFKGREQRQNFYFITAGGNFANLEKIKCVSAVDAALSTGYLGSTNDDIWAGDLSDVEALLAKPAPLCVCEFFRQFQFKIKQPHEAEMTRVLKEKIGKHFEVTDNWFYYYFYERMLDFLLAASDAPVTEAEIEKLFATARVTLERNRLVGHSQRYEYHLRHLHGIKLDVDVTTTLVAKFLDSTRNLMACYGQNDWLIAMTICSELQHLRSTSFLKEDSYGFIDARYAILNADEEVFEVKQFQLLIIDHAESLKEKQLQAFIVQAKRTKKNLILLTVDQEALTQRIKVATGEEVGNETFYEIAPLSPDVVDRNIAAKVEADEGVMIGNHFMPFCEMKLCPAHCGVMSDPYALAAMLKQTSPRPAELKSSPRLFIKPLLTYKNPIYSVEAVLGINHSVVHFDEADLSCIVQILTLDLATLSREERKASLKELIKARKEELQPWPEALCVLNAAEWNKLSQELQRELKAYGKLIFIGESIPEELGTPLELCHHMLDGKSRYVLADAAMFEYMPKTTEYASDADRLYDETLVLRTEHPCRRIILSDYGSGKTYLTEELLRDQNSTFRWIIRMPAKTLDEKMGEWNLEQLAEHYLGLESLEEWQRRLLQCEVGSGNVLWVLDGFDEMLTKQRKALNKLIQKIVKQPHCLIASRPSATPFIPLQPNQFITLKPFDDKQIGQFVNGFFDDAKSRKRAKRLIALWQEENRLSLLGKPLMCRIACEIIAAVGTGVEELHEITLARLFDYFIQVNFRKYQLDHNRVDARRLIGRRLYHLSSAMVERLKQVAYVKLFPRHVDICLLPDDVLDTDLLKFGLVTQIDVVPATNAAHYVFDHQTQLEYFAALYWVEELLQVPAAERIEYVKRVWADELYNIELRVVWQFVAGIVSTDETVFLAGYGRDAFEAFCSFLLDSAEDLVGKVYHELLYGCYHNMQQAVLADSKYKSRFEERVAVDVVMSIPGSEDKRIQEFRIPGSKRQTPKQIIKEHAYRTLHAISSYRATLPNDAEERIRKCLPKEDSKVLAQLPLLKKYLDQDEVDEFLVTQIRDRILAIYPEYKDNAEEYLQAYALLTFMLDHNLIALQDCVKTFTRNFDQKNCVLDVVQRLHEASLLTNNHMKILFKTGRPRFWDYNAGLPAVLLLRDRFNASMAEMLRTNIAERNRGDWEIDRAIQILTEISQESYNFTQTSILLRLIVEIHTTSYDYLNKRQWRILEHTIFTSQTVNSIIDFFSSYFASVQLYNIQYFDVVLQWLYRFCWHYDLAVVMENNCIRILGRIQANINLPKITVIRDFTCEMLRALRKRQKDTAGIAESEALRHTRKQLQACQIYCAFLRDRNNWIDGIDGIDDEDNLAILRQLATFLPPPTQIEKGLQEDFRLLGEKLPSQDTFPLQIAVLRAFGRPLTFVDKYLHKTGEYYIAEGTRAHFWDCNAGIAVTTYLGNDFGEGAYKYLKYCYASWDCCSDYVQKAMLKITADELSNPTAIWFVLKTLLVINITDGKSLNCSGKEFVENLQGFDQKTLVQEFIHLLQNTELTNTEPEYTKLKLLSTNWKAVIQACLKEGIERARVASPA